MEPQKSIVMPIVVSILGTSIVLGGATYYFGMQQSSNQPTTSVTTAPISIASTIPTATPSSSPTPLLVRNLDIASWQTFENKDLGISFKYPKEYGSAVAQLFKAEGVIGDEKGKGIKIVFSSNPQLVAGTVTSDYYVNYGPADWVNKSFKPSNCTTEDYNNTGRNSKGEPFLAFHCKSFSNESRNSVYLGEADNYGQVDLVGFVPLSNKEGYVVLTFDGQDTSDNARQVLEKILSSSKIILQ
jgi:hypothetical protein